MISTETTAPAQAPGQVTLSTIGDIHVAVDDAVQQTGSTANRVGWTGIAAYTLLAYLAGLSALLCLDTAPRAGDLIKAPLAPAAVGLLAAWSRARWKTRAWSAQAGLRAARNSSASLAHEAATGLDAIRAHMIALAAAEPECAASAHFAIMSRGADRINATLRRFEQSRTW